MPQCRAQMQCDVLCGDLVQSGPPAPSERKRVRSHPSLRLCCAVDQANNSSRVTYAAGFLNSVNSTMRRSLSLPTLHNS